MPVTQGENGFHLEAPWAFPLHAESGAFPDALPLTTPALASLQLPYKKAPGKALIGNVYI